MSVITLSIEHYINLIELEKPFTFARYGDGEWMSILGRKGRNCDGVQYTDSLRSELTRTLIEKRDYYYGLLKIAVTSLGSAINEFEVLNDLKINWVEGTVFVAANRNGRLAPFIQALRNRRLLYVGPKHLSSICGTILPSATFFEISSKQAFQFRRDIREKVLEISDGYDFIGFSAGPASKVIIHDLYDKIGHNTTLFDFGSLWDGYVGVNSRLYMQRDSWKENLRKNLEITA